MFYHGVCHIFEWHDFIYNSRLYYCARHTIYHAGVFILRYNLNVLAFFQCTDSFAAIASHPGQNTTDNVFLPNKKPVIQKMISAHGFNPPLAGLSFSDKIRFPCASSMTSHLLAALRNINRALFQAVTILSLLNVEITNLIQASC